MRRAKAPPQPPPVPPLRLQVGALVTAIYADGRVFRAQVTSSITPHLIIRHTDAYARLVADPPDTTRLFWLETLVAVVRDTAGNPVARLEPNWPEMEQRHAA